MSPSIRKLCAMALVLLGACAWLTLGRGIWGAERDVALLAVAAVVALVPAVNRRVCAMLDRLRQPSPLARARITLAVWLAATAYLTLTAFQVDRILFARTHDENSYAIQTRMLATGHLWQPAHPVADSFESFHILVRPVYASIYFPGTALMSVPGVWLGLPLWIVPLLASGLAVALAYRVTAETIDGVAGLLVALVMLGVPSFRTASVMLMAQTPALLLGLATILAWLKWRAGGRRPWLAALAGGAAGWAAITRPVDALAFAIPVGVAAIVDLARARVPLATWLASAAAAAGCALPFLALQIALNVGTTGSPLKTPYVVYLEQSQPGSVFGLAERDRAARPGSRLPQKQRYFDEFLATGREAHDPRAPRRTTFERLVVLVFHALPHPLLLLLIPAAVLGLRTAAHGVVGAVLPLFLVLYAFNPHFLPHYVVPLGAPLAYLVLLGARVLESLPGGFAGRAVTTFVTAAVVVLGSARLPQLDRQVDDEPFEAPLLRRLHERVLPEVRRPALLLFTFTPADDPHEEPVYNSDVARIDDAAIVKAHDLGPEQNARLLHHYAERQEDRHVYRYDRGSDTLSYLGTADELARKP